ncbi:hypothetical protein [Terrisporobacter hibernicus]|uniref:Uncharacterized protein n=1 Tax=Terrisporobacter hibernicus TaxID=2813371 RepID=A0AAX2ZI97_9FIRM|nr:hypothetical protein [Terrisporobacter hibernicus]UEL48215.1 hypothetical protein JW646_01830 [Terrisporobacter hibernicus]
MKYSEEWISAKCDKYDYLIAAFSGVGAGLIDIFFVGAPGNSALCNFTDAQADKLVMKFSKSLGWSPRVGQEESVASAIGFLENKFTVNYDQAHKVAAGGALDMAAKNHHFKSLSHSPDLVGLFFSILDQFQGKSTFLSDGQLIRIDATSSKLRLEGSNLHSKIFCGFCNWLGHIMSDLAGSSGGRGAMTGRGSGVAIPFMPLFQMCDFGQLQVGKNRNTLAIVMTKVFQEGYDLRFGAAMAIPVILNELMIRVLWVIKNRFYKKKEWKECIPSQKHADLRMMLIVGHGTLCIIDGADAAIKSGGNAVAFVLRLNIIGWARLLVLVFKELRIRYGNQIMETFKSFFSEMWDILNTSERQLLYQYHARMEAVDRDLNIMLNEFIDMVNEEYLLMYGELEASFNEELSSDQRLYHSTKLAEICGVEDEKIIRSDENLFDFFEN